MELHALLYSTVSLPLKQMQADKRFVNIRVIVAMADPLLAHTLRDMIDLALIKPVSHLQLSEQVTRFL